MYEALSCTQKKEEKIIAYYTGSQILWYNISILYF